MGRWAQARRRGGAGTAVFPNVPPPSSFTLSRDAGTNKLFLAFNGFTVPNSGRWDLVVASAPGTVLETIATADVNNLSQDYLLVPTSAVTYQIIGTLARPGFATTAYLSNTFVWP